MLKNIALLTFAVVVVGSCAPKNDPGGIAIRLPEKMSALSAEDAAAITATLEITGVLAESSLTINRELTEAEGAFTVDPSTAGDHEFIIRLRYEPDEQTEVLLATLRGTITIAADQDNVLEPANDYDICGAVNEGDPCALVFDLNRNGRPNLDDLVEEVDPRQPPPFVDVAPRDLAFPSGIRLGTFSRQVIVIENSSAKPVNVRATLIDAPGATLSFFETEPAPEAGAQRSLNLGTLAAFQEVLVAVSFAPVNPFLTVGDIFVEAVEPVSGVRQSTRVRLLANVDGELQPPPLGFEIPDVDPEADLGGFTGLVESFPTTSLFNGLPVSSVASADGAIAGLPFTGAQIAAAFADGAKAVPADHAFIVDVPPDHKLAVSLAELQSDVDLAVLFLEDGDVISEDPLKNVRVGAAGTSAEAVEHTNESGTTERALIVLGRVEVDAPPELPGALSADEPAPFSLGCHVTSAPEFTAPLNPLGGPLEGGTRVTLRGRRFHPQARVTFADSIGLDCSFALDGNETVFECTAPPGSLQVGKNPATIVVANPEQDEGGDGQAATLPEGFTYEPPAPRLDTIIPPAAPTSGSTEPIALLGAFFSQRNGTPKVFFGSDEAAGVQFVSSSRITVRAPPRAAGIVAVSVQNILDPQPGDPPGFVRLSLPSNARNFTFVTPDNPAPTVTSVAPSTGAIDGGDFITITGTNFLPNATVLLGKAICDDVNVVSSTSIICTTPERGVSGAVDVEVFNVDGQVAVLPLGFTYFVPDPTIQSVFPESATVAGGTFIVISGSGFRAGVRVEFQTGSQIFNSPNVNRVSTTTVLAASPSVPDGGAYTVRVLNLDGRSAELAGVFQYLEPTGPAPRVDGISPNAGDKDLPVVVTLTGAEFRAPNVLVGAVPAQVTAADTAGAIDTVSFVMPTSATAGPVVVRLINDDGQSDTGVYTYFTVVGAPPVIDTLAPNIAGRGATLQVRGRAFDVVDNGQGGFNLDPEARVLIGGQLVTPTSVSSTQLSLLVPDLDALIGGASAAVAVEVTNSDQQSTSATFTYVANDAAPDPRIQSVSPGVARVGGSVTIAGSGFDLAALVVGNTVLSAQSQNIVAANGGTITFTVPDPGVALPAVVALTVTNRSGKSASASLGIDVPFVAPPRITAIAPDTVQLTGGAVTLSGSGFNAQGTLNVAGANVAATANATSVSFVAPARATPGSVVVRFTNPDGQSDAVTLVYTAEAPPPPVGTPPRIDAISPDTVPVAGNVTVTLSGAAFEAAGVLTVAGAVVNRTVAANGASVTFTAPPRQAEGIVVVRYENAGNVADEISLRYSNNNGGGAPAIGFVDPDIVHAGVPGDFVDVVGNALDQVTGTTVAIENAQAEPRGTATIIERTSLSLRLRIDAALPEEALRFRATTTGGGSITSPLFDARLPRIDAVITQDGSTLIVGDHLNPNALAGAQMAGGTQAIPIGVLSRGETIIVTEQLPAGIPGLTLTLQLLYTDLVSGQPLPPTAPLNAPSTTRQPIEIDTFAFGDEVPAGQNPLGLVHFVALTDDVVPEFGTPTQFVLLTEGGVEVARGDWTLVAGDALPPDGGADGAGEIVAGNVARLQFTSTTPLVEGDFRLRLLTDLSPAVGETLFFRLRAATRRVDFLSPSTAQGGASVQAFGVAFLGDRIVLENAGDNVATEVATINPGFCSVEQPGCLFQPSFTIPSAGVPNGTYRVCTIANGDTVACAQSNVLLTVSGNVICGDASCDVGENANVCSQDCEPNTCGNRTCDPGEDLSCVSDCEFVGPDELEPNDDGTPDLNVFEGNDFLAAAANGPVTRNVTLHGFIPVAGDEDWFRLENPTPTPVNVRARAFMGAPFECQGGGDPVLSLRDATGAFITTQDDSFGLCSDLSFSIPPNSLVFLGMIEFGDNNAFSNPNGWFMVIEFQQAGGVCGNGVCETGEDPETCPQDCGGEAAIVVNTAVDAAPDGLCSLREAVFAANDGVPFDACNAGSTILLPPGIFALPQGPLEIIGDVAIVGAGARNSIISGPGDNTAISVFGGAFLTLQDVGVQDGGNSGIRNSGTLEVFRSHVVNNAAGGNGGGIVSNSGFVTIFDSTIANNLSQTGQGGGISMLGGTLRLTNSTVSGNGAGNGGGGIHIELGAQALISYSTITNNDGATFAGGIIASGSTTLVGTIIAGNGLEDCFAGPINSQGFNIVGEAQCGGFGAQGDQIGIIPPLGPLLNNGGETDTHELFDGPGVDQGHVGQCIAVDGFSIPIDQRGSGRPSGAACDVGAFERGGAQLQCPNGVCEAGETPDNCPEDCGAPPPVCGNAVCEPGEDSINCPADCGAAANFGDGRDGPVFFSGVVNLNNVQTNGRICADAFSTTVIDFPSPNEALLSAPLPAGCLVGGDRVLVVNLQGSGDAVANVGNFEVLIVGEAFDNIVFFQAPKARFYGDAPGSDLGMNSQRVMLQRIPQYQSVTLANGIVTVDAWDGQRGGVLAFMADGVVQIDPASALDVAGLGYRGGPSPALEFQDGDRGESLSGFAGAGQDQFFGAGGGGLGDPCAGNGSPGGGGAHASDGAPSNALCGGLGGLAYANPQSLLTLGGGGGAGGNDDTLADNPPGGVGGSGGGAVLMAVRELILDGAIDANGFAGQGDAVSGCSGTSNVDCWDFSGAGGGGGGGSIRIDTTRLSGAGPLFVSGGLGGHGGISGEGGNGGNGFILAPLP